MSTLPSSSTVRPKRLTVVTGCNERYLPLLEGWLGSVRKSRLPQGTAIAVIDLGLSTRSIAKIIAEGPSVVAIDHMSLGGNWGEVIKSVLIRPRLPLLLPEADVIFWADCDCWFQSPDAIASYAEAADMAVAACAAEVDRSYAGTYKKLFGDVVSFDESEQIYYFRDALEAWLRVHFKERLARYLSGMPLLNTGLLCMPRESPIWDLWLQLLNERVAARGSQFFAGATEIERSCDFMLELMCFNAVVYTHGFQPSVLPSSFNWMAHLAIPVENQEHLLCEPQYPFSPLHVVHLASVTKWETFAVSRVDKRQRLVATVTRDLRSPTTVNLR